MSSRVKGAPGPKELAYEKEKARKSRMRRKLEAGGVEVDEDEERRGRTCFIVQFTLAATASGCLQVVFTHR